MRVSVSASKLSTCARNKVGCVLTSMDDMLLSTGFNGTPIGVDHCTVTNPQKFTPCNCLHAEQNAIIRCEESWRTNKIAYVTVFPCFSCAKLLVGINVKQIYYLHDYRDMKKSGKLNTFLSEREDRYLRQISFLLKQGFNMAEARELAWGDLMSLPGVEE